MVLLCQAQGAVAVSLSSVVLLMPSRRYGGVVVVVIVAVAVALSCQAQGAVAALRHRHRHRGGGGGLPVPSRRRRRSSSRWWWQWWHRRGVANLNSMPASWLGRRGRGNKSAVGLGENFNLTSYWYSYTSLNQILVNLYGVMVDVFSSYRFWKSRVRFPSLNEFWDIWYPFTPSTWIT